MRKTTLLAIVGGTLLLPAAAQSIRTNPEFLQSSIPANDDGSSDLVTLPFTVNFFGRIRTSAYVNNNGNITFDQALPTYTPFGLDGVAREIIAPFFADVDTRKGSKLVTYGTSKIGTHAAFGVNYVNVGYYNQHSDKLNSFQLVLIERADTGAGNFDIEFNYEKITWETGDASGGTSGLGGVSASVGWSNGSGAPGTSWQMAGSLIPGSFLDNAPHALAGTRYSSTTVGRFLFRARGGILIPALSLDTGCPVPNASAGAHYQYTLSASGETAPYSWTLLPDPGATLPFSVSTAGILSGDPKDTGTYNFTLQVSAKTDDSTVTVAKRCSVTVDPPKLSIRSACPLPQAVAGAAYSQKFVVAGGTAPYNWVADRGIPGLTLKSDGTLSGTPTATGTYPFLLSVTSSDAGVAPVGLQCSISVKPAAPTPTISACPAADATRGVPYSQTLGVSGGASPYVWSLDGGQLPRGLGFTSNGLLSGIPDAAGTFGFRLRSLDARGQAATQDCSITVSEPEVKLMTSCPLPNAAIGRAYNQQLSASGGAGSYAWTIAGSLPAGLQLASNGLISGTPTAAGPSLFRLIATDAKGSAVGSQCSLSVVRPVLSIDSCPLRPGLVGQDYVQDLTAIGGASPYLWTVDGGLPPGLSYSTYGRISGKPTAAGDYAFTLRTVDAGGQSVSQACSVSIDPPLPRATTSCPLPAGEVGKPYSASFSAQGGTPPYAWYVDGPLPPDLSLSGHGTIAGVPSKTGTYAFNLLGIDARNRALAQTCSVTIALPDVPTLRTSDVAATVAPATSNIATGVELSDVYSLPLQGTATLTVTPQTGSDAEVNMADPLVRFLNNDRTIRFSIPAGTKKLAIPILSSGTVASSITFAVTSLEVAGNKLPQAPSAKVMTVAPAAPTLTTACFTTPTGGIALTVTGYSTTRAIDSATVTLDGKVVAQSTKTSSFDYFGNDLSIRTGGAFTLTLPTITTSTVPSTVSVVLNNSAGSSTSRSASRCQ